MLLVWSVLVALVANVFVLMQRWTEVLVTLLVGLVGFGLYGLVRLLGGVEEGRDREAEGGAPGLAEEEEGRVRAPKTSADGVTVVTPRMRVWEAGGSVDWPWVVFWAEVVVVLVLAAALVAR